MDIFSLIAEDNELIVLRKSIISICDNSMVASAILSKAIYYAQISKFEKKQFFKFKEPCNDKSYTDGNSWCEMLGITVYKFDKAIKILKEKGFLSTHTGIDRKTWYFLNFEKIGQALMKIKKSDLNEQKHALNQRESVEAIKDTTKEIKRVKTQEKAVFSLTLKTKAKFQNLSDKYRQELRAKIEQYQRENPSAMSYDEFANQCEANGYSYANFWLAFLNWEKMRKERKSAQRNSAQSLQERNFQVMAEWAREMEEKERNGEMIETELLK